MHEWPHKADDQWLGNQEPDTQKGRNAAYFHSCLQPWMESKSHKKLCLHHQVIQMAMRGTAKKLTFTECEIQSFAAGAVGGLSYYLQE